MLENFYSFNNRQQENQQQYYLPTESLSPLSGNCDTSIQLNPVPTQDDSRIYGQRQLQTQDRQTREPDNIFISKDMNQVSPIQSSTINEETFSQNGIFSNKFSQNTPQAHNTSKQFSNRNNSNSASKRTQVNQNPKYIQNLIASPYSPGSIMTQKPGKIQDVNIISNGINDAQSNLYKNFDNCSRTQNAFLQKASQVGANHLQTSSYRRDSPLRQMKSRFPEKYENRHFNTYQSQFSIDQQELNEVKNQDLSSMQVIQNLFPQYVSNDRTYDQENQLQEQEEDFNQQQTLNDQIFTIEASFQAVTESIMLQQGSYQAWMGLSIEDKLLQFTSFLSHMRKDLRLGGLTGIYLLIKHNEIGEEIKRVVIEEIFQQLNEFDTQEELFIKCALEVIGSVGPNEKTFARIGILKGLLCEPSLKRLQENSFGTLMQLGYEGFQSLVEMAAKDYNSLQTFILNGLLQVRAIQRIILVPSILTQLNLAENNQKKQECLAILNRMSTLVWESGGLPIILDLLEEGTIDRQLLASVLRTSGEEGEEMLLKIIRLHKNHKVRMAAASVLSFRRPFNEKQLDIELRLEQNEGVQINVIPPGQIFRYNGPINSLIQEYTQKGEDILQDYPFVEVNSRDFIASLHRMIAMNNDYFRSQFDSEEEIREIPQLKKSQILNKFNPFNIQSELLQDQALSQNFERSLMRLQEEQIREQSFGQKLEISENVIRSLAQQLLKEEKAQVREVIAATIGQIGLPEAQLSVDSLIKVLSNPNEESNVKAMAVWALGRLAAPQLAMKCKHVLIASLKDHYWKVRAAACTAVAQFGESVSSFTIPILTKLLRDGQVNRQTVAETIIKVGMQGEQTLVQILKGEPENNQKLRECIVRALALANVNNPNIDFVIEILFQTSKQVSQLNLIRDKNAPVRKASLLSLDILHKKSQQDSVTYLKARHLLPFFYRCLNDKDKSVRSCALLCIQNFGPQGELMFIEGVTKDKSATIRCECASGLGQIGPQTFRTLLLALHDHSHQVREAASVAILKNMTPEDIDQEFYNKEHQRQTIKCAIREVVQNQLPLSTDIRLFLNRVLAIFEGGNEQQFNLTGGSVKKVWQGQDNKENKGRHEQSLSSPQGRDNNVKKNQFNNLMLFQKGIKGNVDSPTQY